MYHDYAASMDIAPLLDKAGRYVMYLGSFPPTSEIGPRFTCFCMQCLLQTDPSVLRAKKSFYQTALLTEIPVLSLALLQLLSMSPSSVNAFSANNKLS